MRAFSYPDAEQIEHYTRSTETSAELAAKPTVLVLGPFAVGKTTLIEEVTRLDPGFVGIKGFTSRGLRPEEAALLPEQRSHRFLETRSDWDNLHKQLAAGTIAHIIRHPQTGHIMGSTIDEYKDVEFPIIDLSYAAVNLLPSRLSPFMVVTNPSTWHKWVEPRSPLSDFPKRHQDAKKCLEWGLEHDIAWIYNVENDASAGAEEIIAISRGIRQPNPDNRHHGEVLLESIKAHSTRYMSP